MGKEYKRITPEFAAWVATQRGEHVVEPGPRDLFIDLDDSSSQYVMEALLPLTKAYGFPVEVVKITRSKHGNKHAYLEVPELPGGLGQVLRIALQACLGSDRKRELLSILNHLNGVQMVTLFFEPEPKEGPKEERSS